jgi:hypothetical protein
LSTVIAKIGQPMGERSIAGKRVYYWGTPTPLSSKSDRGLQCQIQATMNGDVVERLAYEGDEALCLKYAAGCGRSRSAKNIPVVGAGRSDEWSAGSVKTAKRLSDKKSPRRPPQPKRLIGIT